jgi:hypothetical protein
MQTVTYGFGLNLQIGREFFPVLESFDCSKNLLHGVCSGLRICVQIWFARDCTIETKPSGKQMLASQRYVLMVMRFSSQRDSCDRVVFSSAPGLNLFPVADRTLSCG